MDRDDVTMGVTLRTLASDDCDDGDDDFPQDCDDELFGGGSTITHTQNTLWENGEQPGEVDNNDLYFKGSENPSTSSSQSSPMRVSSVTPIVTSIVTPPSPPHSVEEDSGCVAPGEPQPLTNPVEQMNWEEIKAEIWYHVERLGWDKEEGKAFLLSRYGKDSLNNLEDAQFIDFVKYLRSL